jgi:hypothetical protein
LRDVEAATLNQTIGSQMAVRSALYPQEDSWYSFLLRDCVELRAIVQLERVGKLKKSIDLIGKGTRDLPACSIVPQPTTLSRAPEVL